MSTLTLGATAAAQQPAPVQEPESIEGEPPPLKVPTQEPAPPVPPEQRTAPPSAIAPAPTAEPSPQDKAAEHVSEILYGRKGTFEVGGSASVIWTPDLFAVGGSPSIGYFVADLFELSLIANFSYQSLENDDGTRDKTTLVAAVFEPSYHLQLSDRLFAFGGLGVGGGFDGNHGVFDVVPRVGLNIAIGRAGVFTPAVRVPISFGKGHGADNDQIGATAGVAFEMGITTTF